MAFGSFVIYAPSAEIEAEQAAAFRAGAAERLAAMGEEAVTLADKRAWTVRWCDERGYVAPETFTCDDCAMATICSAAFDPWNNQGDCLAAPALVPLRVRRESSLR